MIRVKLFEELIKNNIIVMKYKKKELKKTLLLLARGTGYVIQQSNFYDDFIIAEIYISM